MSAVPVTVLILAAAGLALSRPWLEAGRPPAMIAIGLGIVIGLLSPRAAGPAPLVLSFEPIFALAAGWLVLAAAESWDLSTLRAGSPGRLALAACLPALLAPLAATAAGGVFAAVPFVLLACAALALDPQAARDRLGATPRPDSAVRAAPRRASLLLGAALLGTSVVSGLAQAGSSPAIHPSGMLALHVTGSLALGIALGVGAAAAVRLAGGRALVTAVLICVTLAGWGVARLLLLSPPAVLFATGVVLACDTRKCDLTFTALRALDRPFTLALLVLAGMRLASATPQPEGAASWLPAAVFAVALPIAWRLTPSSPGAGPGNLPLSPLVLPFAFLTMTPAWLAAAIVAAFVTQEAGYLLVMRRARTGG